MLIHENPVLARPTFLVYITVDKCCNYTNVSVNSAEQRHICIILLFANLNLLSPFNFLHGQFVTKSAYYFCVDVTLNTKEIYKETNEMFFCCIWFVTDGDFMQTTKMRCLWYHSQSQSVLLNRYPLKGPLSAWLFLSLSLSFSLSLSHNDLNHIIVLILDTLLLWIVNIYVRRSKQDIFNILLNHRLYIVICEYDCVVLHCVMNVDNEKRYHFAFFYCPFFSVFAHVFGGNFLPTNVKLPQKRFDQIVFLIVDLVLVNYYVDTLILVASMCPMWSNSVCNILVR